MGRERGRGESGGEERGGEERGAGERGGEDEGRRGREEDCEKVKGKATKVQEAEDGEGKDKA